MRRLKRGIAWYSWNKEFDYLKRLQATYYYNAFSFKFVNNGRAIPMIRANRPIGSPLHWRVIAQALGRDWRQPVLFANEPELVGQDYTGPGKLALLARQVRGALPYAPFVGPNILASNAGFYWLSEYLRIGGRPFDAWGIHFYRESGMPPEVAISRLVEIVKGHGHECDNIWITETGYVSNRPECQETLTAWLKYFDNEPRVKLIFGYTAWEGNTPFANMFLPDEQGKPGELAANGRAWVA